MRTKFFLAAFLILSGATIAQNNGTNPPQPGSSGDRLKSPDMSIITGEPYGQGPLKAKDTTNIIPQVEYSRMSVGINFGTAFYAGDVPMDAMYPAYGGFFKYSLNHNIGVRAQYIQGRISGAPGNDQQRADKAWFHSTIQSASLQFLFNLGSIDYRKSFPRNNFYLGFGASMQYHNAKKDSPDVNGNYAGCSGSNFAIPFTFGFKRKIQKNFDLGIEATYALGANDLIDMYDNKISGGSLPDGNGYIVAGVTYNITTKRKPKHIDWANPIDKMYRDFMDTKDEVLALKNDNDKDGVPDMYDLEPNTKDGYKVDSKGVTLDSDGDGIPDTIDPDPYGFDKAVGKYFPDFKGSGDTAATIYKINDSIPQTDFVTISQSGYGLPTITFPPNGYTVHVEQYNLLQQIARILMADTSASLAIIGHADNNKPNLTQLTLAERRALEVKRKIFKVYEISEQRLLVFSEKDPYIQKYQLGTEGLNRKVEFRIIRPKR